MQDYGYTLKIVILLIAAMAASVHAQEQVEWQDYWSYELKAGETLAGVCADQVVYPVRECQQRVANYNKLASLNPGIGTRFNIPVKWLREARAGIQISSAFGEVYYRTKKDSKWQMLTDKTRFFVGDKVKTGKGNVLLSLRDGSTIEVSNYTQIEFSELTLAGRATGKIKLLLEKGRIHSRVSKRESDNFEVVTPIGVAAVRGTQFRVRLDKDSSNMYNEVLEGAVDVSRDQQSALVKRDYGVKLDLAKGLSEPKRLLEPPRLQPLDPDTKAFRVIRVAWEQLKKAAVYEYELYRGEQLLLKQQTSEPRVSISVFEPSQYHVLVRGVDSDGFIGKDARLEFEVGY